MKCFNCVQEDSATILSLSTGNFMDKIQELNYRRIGVEAQVELFLQKGQNSYLTFIFSLLYNWNTHTKKEVTKFWRWQGSKSKLN